MIILTTNYEDFMKAVKKFDSSVESITFATVDGHIGALVSGKIPKRRSIEDSMYIRDGTKLSEDWYGFIEEKEMPQNIDPPEGYLVACNNKVSPVKGSVASTGPFSGRANRAHEMLSEWKNQNIKLTKEHMKLMQTDTVDVCARNMVKYLLLFLENNKEEIYKEFSDSISKILLLKNILKNWDFDNGVHSQGALVYNIWLSKVKDSLLTKQFPHPAIHSIMTNSFYQFLRFFGKLLISWANREQLNSSYCSRSCVSDVINSLIQTHDHIVKALGPNTNTWELGLLQSTSNPHLPFSNTPLKAFFHREVPGGGNQNTLSVAKIKPYKDRFINQFYGMNRIIASLESESNMDFSYSAGQSGSIFSNHYYDGADDHTNGRYYSSDQFISINWF